VAPPSLSTVHHFYCLKAKTPSPCSAPFHFRNIETDARSPPTAIPPFPVVYAIGLQNPKSWLCMGEDQNVILRCDRFGFPNFEK
jgi:hypothetical protein